MKTEQQSLVPVFLVTALVVFAPRRFLQEFWLCLAPVAAPARGFLLSAACSTGGQCAPAQPRPAASCPSCAGALLDCVLPSRWYSSPGREECAPEQRTLCRFSRSSRSFCPGNLFIVPVCLKLQGWVPRRFHSSTTYRSSCLVPLPEQERTGEPPLHGEADVAGMVH